MDLGALDMQAVSVAALASVALGYFWYSDWFLRKPWIRSMGTTPVKFEREQKKTDAWTELILSALTSLIMAAVFAQLLGLTRVHSAVSGLLVGLFIWMGFVVIVLGSAVFHEGRHPDYFLIMAGHRLVELLMMGAILGAMSAA